MARFKNFSSRLDFFKSISDYHFDPFLKEEILPFDILGHFEGADWTGELQSLEKHAYAFGLADMVANSKARGRANWQFDVSLNQDPSYKQEQICFSTVKPEFFNRETAPLIFKMVDWFALESMVPSIHIQYPGQMFPFHIDGLTKNRNTQDTSAAMNERPDSWARIQVMLTDWTWGQVWAVGNQYWMQWRKGEIMYHPWWSIPHGTANCGYEPRFSLQVSGMLTDTTRDRLHSRGIKINLKDLK